MENNYLISIVGATALGKTALGINLAKHYKTEIISSDSRQFYKEMYIGTAVPSKEELNSVKHHFIQNRSIHENYSVGDFEKDALAKLNSMFKLTNVVVMVGGSGLYVDAILKGLDHFPDIDKKIRENLKQELQEKGLHFMQEKLKEIDFQSYKNIDINNKQRLIRALEVSIATGKPFSSFLKKKTNKRNFIPVKIGLTAEREITYNRINKRVDLMIEEGLLDEAKKLYPFKDLNALQTVGYKELFHFFDGNWGLDFAISEIKKNTRRFAKRQGTWFRKDKEIKWFDYQDDFIKITQYTDSFIKLHQ